MRSVVAAVMAVGLVSGGAAPAFAAPPPLARAASGWEVHYDDQRCIATRRYAVGARALTFGIEPDSDGRGANFIFRPDRLSPNAETGSRPATLAIDGRKVSGRVIMWPDTQNGVLIQTGYGLGDKDPPLALEAAQQVSLQTLALNVTVPLGPIAKVMPLLADCTAGLLESWGFSRADQARMATWPKGAIGRIFQSDDYPSRSLRLGAQGQVSVRYSVGADGKASNCVVRFPSGDPALDKATCDVINQRARLSPALDRDGKPMPAVTTAVIRWVMPGFSDPSNGPIR